MTLKDKYIHNLKRIDKAEHYFKTLDNEAYENIENTKAYKALKDLLKETNDMYYQLKNQGIEVPVTTRGIK